MDVEVRRRIKTGPNAWRNVEGIMVDRNISRKGKVLDSYVVPASRGSTGYMGCRAIWEIVVSAE